MISITPNEQLQLTVDRNSTFSKGGCTVFLFALAVMVLEYGLLSIT